MSLFKKDKPEPTTWAGETASQVSQRDVENLAGSLVGGCRHNKGTQTVVGSRTENRVEFEEVHCGHCDSNYIRIK